jgi:hypothetical protein
MVLGTRYGIDNPKVLGFKEIRYSDIETMRFLAEVFPCARIVFTYR